MSTLSVSTITGLSGRITVPTNTRLNLTSADALVIPRWTTSTRPGSPEIGFWGFNAEKAQMECWNGSTWLTF